MHLRWLIQPPSSMPLLVAVLRFNCSVNYGGLQFANSQEGIFFSENKDKSIHAALYTLVEEEPSNQVFTLNSRVSISINCVCFFNHFKIFVLTK